MYTSNYSLGMHIKVFMTKNRTPKCSKKHFLQLSFLLQINILWARGFCRLFGGIESKLFFTPPPALIRTRNKGELKRHTVWPGASFTLLLKGSYHFLDVISGLATLKFPQSTNIWPIFKILHWALWEIIRFEVYVVIYVLAILQILYFLVILDFDHEESTSPEPSEEALYPIARESFFGLSTSLKPR